MLDWDGLVNYDPVLSRGDLQPYFPMILFTLNCKPSETGDIIYYACKAPIQWSHDLAGLWSLLQYELLIQILEYTCLLFKLLSKEEL